MSTTTSPKGFDFAGAAHDVDMRARLHAESGYANPDVQVCIRLLGRNQAIAPAIREAIAAELAKLPGGGRGINEPLIPKDAPAA